MTQDFLMGLHFEQIGSRRLGQPIFPLRRRGLSAKAKAAV
jgi:hypothetical protein